jgi:signal transduction histidine kinase
MQKELHSTEKRTDLNRYLDLEKQTQTGWWEFYVKEKLYHISDYIQELFGFSDNKITSSDFIKLARSDYRDLIKGKLFEYSNQHQRFKDTSIPFELPQGEIWVRTHICRYDKDGDREYVFGVFQVVPPPEENITPQSVPHKDNMLLIEANAVTESMMQLLTGKNESEILNHLFQNILRIFQASDIFLSEFTPDNKFQTCTHEVTAGDFPIMSRYRFFDNSIIPWLSNKILSNLPAIVDDIDNLPVESKTDAIFFNSLKLKSFIAIPLANEKRVWGFIGIDLKDKKRKWSDEDYLFLRSMSYVAGICISLSRIRKLNENGRRQKDVLLKHLPVGYGRLKIIRDEKQQIIDYKVEEANLLASRLLGSSKQVTGALGSEIHDKEFVDNKIKFLSQVLEKHFYEEDIQINANLYCHKIGYLLEQDEVGELLIDTSETINAIKSRFRSEKLFKDIFINIPVGEAIYDSTGIMTDMNESFMETFGLHSADDVKGYSFLGDRNMTAAIKKLITENNRCSFRIDYDFDKVDNYKTRRHGIVAMNCKIIKLYDDEDKCIGFLFICIEDDDRFISMSKAHDFDDFFQLISNYANIGYAKFNLITKKGYAIRQWYKNIGEENNSPLQEIIGIYNTTHPDDRKRLLNFFEKAKKGKATGFTGEIRVKVNDKKNVWKWLYTNLLITRYTPEEDNIEIIGVNYDITKFKKVEKELTLAREKAETMDKLKSAFLANMSHEIRTPLNAIVGFSDLLACTDDPAERQQYLTILRDNNDLLLQLINDILDLSKLEAGMVELNYGEVHINTLLGDIVQSMKLKAVGKEHLDISCVTPDENCTLCTDHNRITQVLTNFINNSIKFTQEGYIKVGYEWIGNDKIKFYVADTGIGIKKDKLKSVFDRFVKLNDFVQGTGLGLPICRSIIEQMSGTIGVDSKVGEGSTFWFILPTQRPIDKKTKKGH